MPSDVVRSVDNRYRKFLSREECVSCDVNPGSDVFLVSENYSNRRHDLVIFNSRKQTSPSFAGGLQILGPPAIFVCF